MEINQETKQNRKKAFAMPDIVKIVLAVIAALLVLSVLQPRDKAAKAGIYVYGDIGETECRYYPAIIIKMMDDEKPYYWVYTAKINGNDYYVDHGDIAPGEGSYAKIAGIDCYVEIDTDGADWKPIKWERVPGEKNSKKPVFPWD